MFARDKLSSLYKIFVNYGRKKFNFIGICLFFFPPLPLRDENNKLSDFGVELLKTL
jgi:hypothetical protein